MKRQELRYWDTCCFLAWLKNEDGFAETCEDVIRSGELGQLIIVTSALTLAEAYKLKGQKPVDQTEQSRLKDFFQRSYIRVTNIDRFLAESAATLLLEHPGLHPKDSIHLATALGRKIPRFDTFDKRLLGMAESFEPLGLIIAQPDRRSQRTLPFD